MDDFENAWDELNALSMGNKPTGLAALPGPLPGAGRQQGMCVCAPAWEQGFRVLGDVRTCTRTRACTGMRRVWGFRGCM